MLISIPDVIPREDAVLLGARLRALEWADHPGDARGRRLRENDEQMRAIRAALQRAVAANPTFLAAAIPARIHPPEFNRYGEGEGLGTHVDAAIRIDPDSRSQFRTDLCATLFLTDPDNYDGGELTIEEPFGPRDYKLPAGHMLLYAATSFHRVAAVTRGERIASFFWVQSLVPDAAVREMLFDLDQSVQLLAGARGPEAEEVMRLTRVYHNLLRRSS